MTITPIGTVRQLCSKRCCILVLEEYRPGLQGIQARQKLQILYWMHKLPEQDRRQMLAYPQGDRTKPQRGVFALRSPMRPNPIGVSVVEVTRIDGNRLTVTGLDALDGSPVIDIKAAAENA